MSVEPLDQVVEAQERGKARGIVSICSAHPYVLRAVLQRVARMEVPVLVEATCNQVNQFGGYTGMVPGDFAHYVTDLAGKEGLPRTQVILGGDHLGPSAWQDETAESAMLKAEEMVRAYVKAGFVKIHLDASMRLGDDAGSSGLDVEISAQRSARLAKAAESAFTESGLVEAPRYVIGSEVPIPGGAREHEDELQVTTVESARRTLDAVHSAFRGAGLGSAWERVLALVVQPGVEFGDDFVLEYQPEKSRELVRFVETLPIVYEAHSTDYQSRESLRQLVQDHFAILKVGPGLTFAFREAVFALAGMEAELLPDSTAGLRSHLVEEVEQAMLRSPANWQKHYHGSSEAQRFARKYSLSDRIRYYWGDPQVQQALERLLINLRNTPLPDALLSQYMPVDYEGVRTGKLERNPEALLLAHIDRVLEDYAVACGGE